jgi:hypothetical protein
MLNIRIELPIAERKDCRFLIVQGVGHYDFRKLAQAPNAEIRTGGA